VVIALFKSIASYEFLMLTEWNGKCGLNIETYWAGTMMYDIKKIFLPWALSVV
jgi:hypothetical protein